MPNFVESLKAAGAIDSSTVTFNLNKDETQASTITLGSTDVANGVTRGDSASFSTTMTQPWKIHDTSLTFGTEAKTGISTTISTGSPFIYLPEAMYTAFETQIPASSGLYCDENGCINYDDSCDTAGVADSLPTFEFSMLSADGSNNYKISVPGAAMTWSPPDLGGCYLMVQPFDQVVLGTLFMTNFITTFDVENGQISLTANANAPEGVTITSTAVDPSDDDSDGLGGGAIAGIVIGGLAGMILIAVGIYFFTKKKGEDNKGYSGVDEED